MRHITPLAIRMPSDLKEKIEHAAFDAHRSLNAELIVRLENSFRSPLQAFSTADLVAELVARQKVSGIVVKVGSESE